MGQTSATAGVRQHEFEAAFVDPELRAMPSETGIASHHDVARPGRWRATIRLCRPHQWIKNTLVFVPLVLGGAIRDPHAVAMTIVAFAALSLLASGTYAFNDVVDIDNDRAHPTKCRRPLASGALSVSWGVTVAVALVAAGLGLGAVAGQKTSAALMLYLASTLAYSVSIKRVAMLDVVTLAGLFTLRLAIGTMAAGVALSPWLLTFSMFLFLSLSLAKRHTELVHALRRGLDRPAGRGYSIADEPLVLAAGVGALVAAVLVFVLYLTQEAFVAAHLATPRLLWVVPPVIFLLGARIWLISGRGELDDDPVAFLVHDVVSLGSVATLALVTVFAWIGVPVLFV